MHGRKASTTPTFFASPTRVVASEDKWIKEIVEHVSVSFPANAPIPTEAPSRIEFASALRWTAVRLGYSAFYQLLMNSNHTSVKIIGSFVMIPPTSPTTPAPSLTTPPTSSSSLPSKSETSASTTEYVSLPCIRCQYSSEDGFLNDWHLVHLGNYAKGGAGLIYFEAAAVAPNGRISPYDAGLWKDEQIPSYRRVVDFIHAHNTFAAFQIAHAGRKASTTPPFYPPPTRVVPPEDGGWNDVVSPSPIGYPDYLKPTELTESGIKEIVEQFVETTKRALAAGFDWLEVHGAHGYLIHSFLSPLSNQRTDSYGGSFENRIRFCVEVVTAVRAVWPEEKPLAVRLSCEDWVEGGWDLKQTIQLSSRLQTLGVDLIDCSSGGISPAQQIPVGPLYQVPFAEEVKKKVPGVLVAVVGMIMEAEEAEGILKKGQADLIMFAREFLREPFWPIKAAAKFGLEAQVTPQYARAYVHYVKHYNEDKK